ncbi:hypothetical protein ABK040_007213 [Willaertia magna]
MSNQRLITLSEYSRFSSQEDGLDKESLFGPPLSRIHYKVVSNSKFIQRNLFRIENKYDSDVIIYLQFIPNNNEEKLSNETPEVLRNNEEEVVTFQLSENENSEENINKIELSSNQSKILTIKFKPQEIQEFSGTIYLKVYYNNNKENNKNNEDLDENNLLEELSFPFFIDSIDSTLTINENEINFGNIVIHQKYTKQITISNPSILPIYFKILKNYQSFKNSLTNSPTSEKNDYDLYFTENENDKKIITNQQLLLPKKFITFTLTFIPKKTIDFNIPLIIENMNNENNVIKLNIKATTLKNNLNKCLDKEISILDEYGKQILSTLNFGSFYKGEIINKLIILRNNSNEQKNIILKSTKKEFYFENSETKEKIDEITLLPKKELIIAVRCCFSLPLITTDEDLLLQKETAKIVLYNSIDKCIITKLKAIANVCTSIVEVSTANINFGDSSIGDIKFASISATNRSDLPARISVQFISKVITCKTKSTVIPPHKSIRITFRLSPRKINPNYRKLITIVNEYNKYNENIIEASSNNIDRNMLNFHCKFYEVHSSSQHNYAKSINFNIVAMHSYAISKFQIENITDKFIKLKFTSSIPEDIYVYIENLKERFNSLSNSSNNRKLSNKTSISNGMDKSLLKKISSLDAFNLNELNNHRDLEEEEPPVFDTRVNNLLNLYQKLQETLYQETQIISLSEQYIVKQQIDFKKNLMLLIQNEVLLECKELEIPPRTLIDIYAVYKPSKTSIQSLESGTLKKNFEKLFIELIEFDKSLVEMIPDNLPSRELTVQAKICQSIMEITQKNINFGKILNNEERKKTLTISNASEVPLLFKIKKTGSIASNDIKILDVQSSGVVGPYGSRDVQFLFKPSLPGKFNEILTIENILDETDNTNIIIKANIVNYEKFSLKSNDVNFNDILINQPSLKKKITVTNMSKNRRVFEVQIDYSSFIGCSFDFDYDLDPVSPSTEIEKLEAELEKLEHKYRICVRKNKQSKIKKLTERINEIKKELNVEEISTPSSFNYIEYSSDEDRKESSRRYKKIDNNGIRFSIPPRMSQAINIVITPKLSFQSNYNFSYEGGIIRMLVFENKNIDIQKMVTLSAKVYYNINDYLDHIQSPSPKFYSSPQISPSSSNVGANVLNTVKSSNLTKQSSSVMLKKVEKKVLKGIQVRPNEIDLRTDNLDESVKCRITLTNESKLRESGFVVLEKNEEKIVDTFDIQFSKLNGSIRPSGHDFIDITCKFCNPGIHRYVVEIQDLKTKVIHKCVIKAHVIVDSPIHISKIGEDRTLNFGFCYLNDSNILMLNNEENDTSLFGSSLSLDENTNLDYTKVEYFDIENKKDYTITLQLTSNSKKQLHLFKDEFLVERISSLTIGPKEKVTIFVALNPYITPNHAKIGKCDCFTSSININVFNEDLTKLIFSQGIKIKAFVGKSVLAVNPSSCEIDLGKVKREVQKVEGSFEIKNVNQYLPLEYEIDSSISNELQLTNSETKGTLLGDKVGESTKKLSFVYYPTSKGLNEAYFIITNRSSKDEETIIKVKLNIVI